MIAKNIFWLYCLQGANYLVPLITIPYLSRVLGVNHFGVLGLVMALVSFMTLLTDWGFSLTATQQVAHNSDKPDVLHSLFWDTFWARMGLGVVAFVGLAVAISLMPSLQQLGSVLLAATVQVIASMLGVGWFLQGLERMGSFVTSSLLNRILAIPLTFLLVHSPEDVAMATLIPGLCGLVSVFVSLRVANRLMPLLPLRFNLSGILQQLMHGAKIFLSTGAINLYTQSNILILASLSGNAEVGLYHGSNRIRNAVGSLIGPVGTVLFPRINHLMSRDRQAAKTMMIRMLVGQGGATFILSVIMFLVAPWGVPLALGHDFSAAVPVVQCMAPIPFLVGVNTVLGINVMLPLGMKNAFATIATASAAINFISMLILCPHFGAEGAAVASVITEIFVTGTMAFILYRKFRHKWTKAAELIIVALSKQPVRPRFY
jgi:polysaccharide transporter, PST family